MRSPIFRRLFAATSSLAFLALFTPQVGMTEIVIDTVVASVDGKPVTLRDVSERLMPARQLTPGQITSDPEAKEALEGLILERLVEAEAENRKIRVADKDVDGYIDEVSARNQMSRSEFEAALQREGRDFATYRSQVRSEILRSRLINQVMQSGVSITAAEIEEFISGNPSLRGAGEKLKLRSIVVSKGGRSEEETEAQLSRINARLENGEQFAKVASEMSDAPERSDGGLLGIMNESDLSRQIFDAVLSVSKGKYSAPVNMDDGIHIFYVEDRFSQEADPETIRSEARRQLVERKSQEKLQLFFTQELTKLHAVDRKV